MPAAPLLTFDPAWRPKFPGDGYTHTFREPELIFSNSDIKGWIIKCPCGQKFYMPSENMKQEWNDNAAVMVCVNEDCKAWHSVLFQIPNIPEPKRFTAKFQV